MKNFVKLISIVALVFANNIFGQKVGVVDTEYILNKLPEYKEAESRLNNQITTWQTEIQNLQTEYEHKKASFENEKVLLVGEQLKQREKEVIDLENNIKTTVNARFGSQGEINNLRTNLTKPFQDKIWNAIKTVSEKYGMGIVLDKSNNISVIFLQKRYDFTDKVLDLLLKKTDSKEGNKNKTTPSRTRKAKSEF